MRQFLDRADDLTQSNAIAPSDKAAFEEVAAARSSLRETHSKAVLDLYNLESVFAAFETASLLSLVRPSVLVRPSLLASMRKVIALTLEQSMLFNGSPSGVRASAAYQAFAWLVDILINHGHQVTILTFNYDIGMDFALHKVPLGINYAIGGDVSAAVELLKLHGSLNWTRCGTNPDHILFEHVRDIETDVAKQLGNSSRNVPMSASSRLAGLKCLECDALADGTPVIVPPTLHKFGEQRALAKVWAAAAARLGEAHHIVVAGYSWPDGDGFFHYLYALGSMGDSILRSFVVLDPDKSVAHRIQAKLLGQQASRNYCYIPHNFGVDGFMAIHDALGVGAVSNQAQLLVHPKPR
jgi:hypothetical protein